MPIFSQKKRSKSAKINPIFHWKGTRDTALIFQFLDGLMAEFNPKIFLFFFDFGHLQGEKGGQNGTKCKNFGYVPFLQNFQFFKNR